MDPYFGFSPAGIAAGVLCGLAVFIIGLMKHHIRAGAQSFGLCVFLGMFVSAWAAVPAAVGLAVALWFGDRLNAYIPQPPAWMMWTPLPFRRNTAPTASTFASAAGSPAAPADEVGHCDACGKGFALKNGATPPWCPNCGADMKK
jgi:hypothetical protein